MVYHCFKVEFIHRIILIKQRVLVGDNEFSDELFLRR